MDFLSHCVTSDVAERYTASQLLEMPFITDTVPKHALDGPLCSPNTVAAATTPGAPPASVAQAFSPAAKTSATDGPKVPTIAATTTASTTATTSAATNATAASTSASTSTRGSAGKAFSPIAKKASSPSACAHTTMYKDCAGSSLCSLSADTSSNDTDEPPRLRQLVTELQREQHPAEDLSVLASIVAEERLAHVMRA